MLHLCLQKLEAIGKAIKGQRVDAVLYLDRLDSYKLDTLDRKVGVGRPMHSLPCAGLLMFGVFTTCLMSEQLAQATQQMPAAHRGSLELLLCHTLYAVLLLRCLPQVIEGISRVLGPRVWDNAVLGFTRASESSAPGGLDFATHVEQRAAALRAAINKVCGGGC